MIGGVNYEMIDDEGNLHITVKSKKKGEVEEQKHVLKSDNIIVCAGQISMNQLEAGLKAKKNISTKIFTIGGAYFAGEWSQDSCTVY